MCGWVGVLANGINKKFLEEIKSGIILALVRIKKERENGALGDGIKAIQ